MLKFYDIIITFPKQQLLVDYCPYKGEMQPVSNNFIESEDNGQDKRDARDKCDGGINMKALFIGGTGTISSVHGIIAKAAESSTCSTAATGMTVCLKTFIG